MKTQVYHFQTDRTGQTVQLGSLPSSQSDLDLLAVCNSSCQISPNCRIHLSNPFVLTLEL